VPTSVCQPIMLCRMQHAMAPCSAYRIVLSTYISAMDKLLRASSHRWYIIAQVVCAQPDLHVFVVGFPDTCHYRMPLSRDVAVRDMVATSREVEFIGSRLLDMKNRGGPRAEGKRFSHQRQNQ